MQHECGISNEKMPVVLTLSQLLWTGDVSLGTVPCAHTVANWDRTMSAADDLLLGRELRSAEALHFAFDTSPHVEETLLVRVTFWQEMGPVSRTVAVLPVVAPTGIAMKEKLELVMQQFGICPNSVYSVVADHARTIHGCWSGAVRLFEEFLRHPLVVATCDLHLLNKGLVDSILAAFGKHELHKPHCVQLAYMISCKSLGLNSNWKRWRELLLPFVKGACGVHEAERLCAIDVPISTRWYTVINALTDI